MYYLPDDQIDAEKIYQGDIFEEFPCFVLASTDFVFLREDGGTFREAELPGGWREEELLIVRARKQRIVLLSQTCDIHEEGLTNLYLGDQEQYANQVILYAPVVPLTELTNYNKLKGAAKDRQRLENQNVAGAFYLPAHPDGRFPESLAYLQWVCGITKLRANRFRTFDPKRRCVSLAPPYREALSSKFAYTFGRVALPSAATFKDNRPSVPVRA
jgi:hypothetical protein